LGVFGFVLISLGCVLRYQPIATPFNARRLSSWLAAAWNGRAFIVVALIVIGLARNTHYVRTIPHDAETLKNQLAWRTSIDESLRKWYAAHKDNNGRAVAILVGAAGGGIRASYWTAAVLASLDQIDDFRHHLFVISSVSGGSLGAVMFRAALTSQLSP